MSGMYVWHVCLACNLHLGMGRHHITASYYGIFKTIMFWHAINCTGAEFEVCFYLF